VIHVGRFLGATIFLVAASAVVAWVLRVIDSAVGVVK
jgi:hypothetical protein